MTYTDIFADDFTSREGLLTRLRDETQVLSEPLLLKAFQSVDRRDFVPEDFQVEAYEDYPLPLLGDQSIPQPSTLAFMLELLEPHNGDSVLEIGSGSGWASALLGYCVGEKGSVIGVDIIPELALLSSKNLAHYKDINVEIRLTEPGFPSIPEAPFDRVLISASLEEIPEDLIYLLNESGILVVPEGETIVKIVRDGSRHTREEYPGFSFVPFVLS